MFWNIFYNLCQASNISPTAVIKELGIAAGSVTAWKKGVTPSTRSLQKIADYFGVTIADLLADAPAVIQPPATDEANDAYKKLEEQIAELRAAMVNERKTAAEPELSPARRKAVEIIKELDDSQLDDVMRYIKFLQSQDT